VSWPSFPQHTSVGEKPWIICWSAGTGWELQQSAGTRSWGSAPGICRDAPPAWEKALPNPAPVLAAGQRGAQALAGSTHCPWREGTMDFQLVFRGGMHTNPG